MDNDGNTRDGGGWFVRKSDDDAWDIEAYDAAAAVARQIFMERREEYGSHLTNPPQYDQDNLGSKLWRAYKKHLAGETPKHDTLIDLANYCLMIVSRRFQKTAG